MYASYPPVHRQGSGTALHHLDHQYQHHAVESVGVPCVCMHCNTLLRVQLAIAKMFTALAYLFSAMNSRAWYTSVCKYSTFLP